MEASTSLEVHVKGVDQNYTRPTPSHEKVAFCITIPNRLFRLWHVEKRTSFKGVINSAMHAKVVKLNEVFLHHSQTVVWNFLKIHVETIDSGEEELETAHVSTVDQ